MVRDELSERHLLEADGLDAVKRAIEVDDVAHAHARHALFIDGEVVLSVLVDEVEDGFLVFGLPKFRTRNDDVPNVMLTEREHVDLVRDELA